MLGIGLGHDTLDFIMTPNISVLKTEIREFCVRHLVLRQIDDIFTNAEFFRKELERYPGGQRRDLVEEYYASADWNNIETVRRFLKIIEQVLSLSFVDESEKEFLRSTCNKYGFEVDKNGFTIHLTTKGVGELVKNIIFAADGPKPEIILSDSISNEIQIVKNAKYCLVYNRPIKSHGLLWSELVDWWGNIGGNEKKPEVDIGRDLYSRLHKSLASLPERNLWKTYFKIFYGLLGKELPALIPQVYLHYDPYTIKQLRGSKRLPRQRMDFLLLLSEHTRVVIEVDGKQHYSKDNIANPKQYSEMVAEDRKLKLGGYEVYRFGGYELTQSNFEYLVEEFFTSLFERHELIKANA